MESQIKSYLVSQKKLINKKVFEIETDNKDFNSSLETLEMGVHSWQSHIADSRTAIKDHLMQKLNNINQTLTKLKNGTYGLCDQCGKQIEAVRLKIMPTTNFCVGCK